MDNVEDIVIRFAKENNITMQEACKILNEYYEKQKEEMNKVYKEIIRDSYPL